MIDEASIILVHLKRPVNIPVIKNPFSLHFGRHGCTSDARGLAADMQGGWKIFVAGSIAESAWSKEILQAIKDGVLSIDPLELITCAMTLKVAHARGVLKERVHGIWRNDKEPAVVTINKRRATSMAMLEALRIFEEVMRDIGCRVHPHHISTVENSTSGVDAENEALREATGYFGFEGSQCARPPTSLPC